VCKKSVKLSKRLQAVLSLVSPGKCVADIGTDHGYVPLELIRQGICRRGLAMDIGPGPLARARAHIQEEELEQKIEVRLSDGLSELIPGEADRIVIAGMGGPLMVRILTEGRTAAQAAGELILSPQSEWGEFRYYLNTHGYKIEEEIMLEEDGKFYTVLKVVPGEDLAYSEPECRYGKRLLERRDPILKKYLQKEFAAGESILESLRDRKTENAAIRQEEVCRKQEELIRLLAEWQTIDREE